jgi:hypothetical protein
MSIFRTLVDIDIGPRKRHLPRSFSTPNTVLKLLLECDVETCLQFAYWETCSRGMINVFSDEPDTSLSPAVVKNAAMGAVRLMLAHVDQVKYVFDSFHSCIYPESMVISDI